MKAWHLYEVRMIDGTRYRGEIAYKDDKVVVLRMSRKYPEKKLRLYYNGIISIQELGWQREFAIR